MEQTFDRLFQGNEAIPEPVVKGTSVELPLDIGDQGPFVQEVQQSLIRVGFPLPIFGADGIYGEETKRAVMKFQRKYGLTVDGLVGPQTLDKLAEVKGATRPINDFPLPSGILRRGDQGTGVRQLQRALQRIGFDPQLIDGIYGPLTENAVRRFQSKYADLQNDGIYGPNTRRFIEMELSEL
ncbi:peptidoglycan-binding domain-containing protein [Radiobacillus deserti]|uniref:peptidoglycan-binding domain-containing protein n=1 Tax=Radiobacillus deserti TaxID=2594883 RepID=UPI001E62F508|nr:peptidoglycan-binding protein [Radiobacillus deserti]